MGKGGFHPSELILIAARPCMGKTSLALNIAVHNALEKGKSVAIFTPLTTRHDIATRMLLTIAKVNSMKLRMGNLGDDDWLRLTEAAEKLYQAPIAIDDSPDLSTSSLSAKARRLKTDGGLDLLIVHGLQTVKAAGLSYRASREEEVGRVSHSLKALAIDHGIPVIATTDLNRKLERRPDKRPMLSDLRESGALEIDADKILFIYRDCVYNPENEEAQGLAEIYVAKHTNGPMGVTTLRFLREFTLFENY